MLRICGRRGNRQQKKRKPGPTTCHSGHRFLLHLPLLGHWSRLFQLALVVAPALPRPALVLADLLVQLTDAQLHDLFEVARFPERVGGGRQATVDEWVGAFKRKREEIVSASCPGTVDTAR